jgi:hypothetical protein
MVLTATLVFVSFFVLSSFLMCIFRRFPLHEAFYGNSRKLLIKYCAFLLSSIALPFALNRVHKFGTTREFYIASAVGISLLSFIAIVSSRECVVCPSTAAKRSSQPLTITYMNFFRSKSQSGIICTNLAAFCVETTLL